MSKQESNLKPFRRKKFILDEKSIQIIQNFKREKKLKGHAESKALRGLLVRYDELTNHKTPEAPTAEPIDPMELYFTCKDTRKAHKIRELPCADKTFICRNEECLKNVRKLMHEEN